MYQMKLWKLTIILIVAALVMAGCEEDETIFDPVPAAPQNVRSITADGEVYLYFNGLYEKDIMEYRIYRSLDSLDGYEYIGTVDAEPNPNGEYLYYYEFIDAFNITNGETYYYAVRAVDFAGQISDLSAEMIHDTPRPEGYVSLYYDNDYAEEAGFNFGTLLRVCSDICDADIYLDYYEVGGITTRYLNVGNSLTDIQDMGYHADTDTSLGFDMVSFSPEDGWATLAYVELIEGHVYVIWTHDNHYAKVHVEGIYSDYARLRWGYQVDEGNIELAPRPPHDEEFMRDKKDMSLLR